MSLFALNTSGELPATNKGVSQYRYDRVLATRNATGTNFSGGPVDFRFTMAGNRWWVPARSYIRMRVKVGAYNAGNEPTDPTGVALAMAPAAAFFQNGRMMLEERMLSEITDKIAEIDVLKTRQNKSKGWLDGIGKQLNVWQPGYSERAKLMETGQTTTQIIDDQALGFAAGFTWAMPARTANNPVIVTFAEAAAGQIPSADIRSLNLFKPGDSLATTGLTTDSTFIFQRWTGALTAEFLSTDTTVLQAAIAVRFVLTRTVDPIVQAAESVEICWKPPMSLFYIENALPVGNYRLELTPAAGTSWKTRVIESLGALYTPGTNVDVWVDGIEFYVASMIGPRVSDLTYYVDLEETHAQTIYVDSASASQKQFTVSPKTYALSVAFQDKDAGSTPQYPVTKFDTLEKEAKLLNRIQVEYANQLKPPVIPTMGYTDDDQHMTERYLDTYLYTGMVFDSSGPESLEDWISRGPYYYFPFPKDAEDESTRVIVRHGFSTLTDGCNMLLFSHFHKMAIVQIENGRVVDVRVLER